MQKTLAETLEDVQKSQSKTLILSPYQLTEIPEAVFEMDWLEELIMGGYHDFEQNTFMHLHSICLLKSLPDAISRLKNLKTLSICGPMFGGTKPDLTHFDGVFELPNLEYLYLDGTHIADISRIGQLKKLKHLNLSDTEIKDFSPIAKLTELTCVCIGDNHIEQIDFLTPLEHLKAISLTTNHLQHIEALSGTTGLKRICLCKNKIADVTPLLGNRDLEHLCCYGLPIATFNFLTSFPNLIRITSSPEVKFEDLKTNTKLETIAFSEVTDAIVEQTERFTQCTYLSLSGNFTTFKAPKREKLETLHLDSNQLNHIVFDENCPKLSTLELTGAFSTIQGLHLLPNLRDLTIDAAAFCDPEILKTLPLDSFYLKSRAIDDLSFLSTLKDLKNLSLYDSPAKSLQPLQQLDHLEYIQLENTPGITDLSPLAQQKHLRRLILIGTGVKSLRPIIHLLDPDNFELDLGDDELPEAAMHAYYEGNVRGLFDFYQNNPVS